MQSEVNTASHKLVQDIRQAVRQDLSEFTARLLSQQGELLRSALSEELPRFRVLLAAPPPPAPHTQPIPHVEYSEDGTTSAAVQPGHLIGNSFEDVACMTSAVMTDGAVQLTPRRRGRLQLPVGTRHASSRLCDSPTGTTPCAGVPAMSDSSLATSIVAEYCRPLDGPSGQAKDATDTSLVASPKSEALVREDTEIQSHFRNEEDEKWRRQWKHLIRSRLSQRLAGHRKSRGASTAYLTDFARSESSMRSGIRQQEPASRLERMVDGAHFQIFCSLIIVTNAIFIGATTNLAMKNAMAGHPQDDPDWHKTCNLTFVGFFMAEILVRIAAKGRKFLFGEDWKWNLFDVVLAVYSLLEELIHGLALTYARLLRSFRMVRVLRVLRVMRFFRELRLMVCSITRSLVSLAWAGLLLLMIMYMFSICFMHASILHLNDLALVAEQQHQRQVTRFEEPYGSVGNTMFSLLMAISGGVDWIALVQPLKEISWIYQALFAFYVLFVLIGVLNVLTSVFVERANELSRLDRDLVIQSEMVSNEAFVNEMQAIFDEVDANCTGKITWKDFHDYLQNEHVQAYFATQQLDTSDARELFNLLDVDQNEEVRVEEFVMGCMRLRGQAKSSDVATLIRENRKASQKNMRVMRKLELLLRSIQGGMKEIRVGQCAPAMSSLPSPSSGTSPSPARQRAASSGLPLPT